MFAWVARRLALRALLGATREAPGYPPAPTAVSAGRLLAAALRGVAAVLFGLVQLALAVALFAACALFIWELLTQ